MQDRDRIGLILTCIDKVLRYSAGKEYDSFSKDSMLVEACVFNLSQIGELCHNMSNEFTTAHPEVPWNASTSGLYGKLFLMIFRNCELSCPNSCRIASKFLNLLHLLENLPRHIIGVKFEKILVPERATDDDLRLQRFFGTFCFLSRSSVCDCFHRFSFL